MTDADISAALQKLEGWQRQDNSIGKTYRFRDHYEAMAFVNAVAWVSHRQDHHPDMTVGYDRCAVSYTTHSAGGLTAKDFACAAKLDGLFAL